MHRLRTFLLATFLGLSLALPAQDNFRPRLDLQLGLFETFFKSSDIRLIQDIYDTDVVIHNYRARDNGYYDLLPTINVSILQYRVKVGLEWKNDWGFEFIASHMHYEGITRDSLRMEGRWAGQEIDETVYLYDYVRKFEHSHAVTTCNLNVRKSFPYRGPKKLFKPFTPLIRAGVGIPIPNSSNDIRNPNGDFEYHGPQYYVGGISTNLGGALRGRIWKGLFLEANAGVYGIFILRGRIANGIARHRIYGIDYGLDLGYSIDF